MASHRVPLLVMVAFLGVALAAPIATASHATPSAGLGTAVVKNEFCRQLTFGPVSLLITDEKVVLTTLACGQKEYVFATSDCTGSLQRGLSCYRATNEYDDGSPYMRLTIAGDNYDIGRGGFGLTVGSRDWVMGSIQVRHQGIEPRPLDPSAGASCTPTVGFFPKVACHTGDGNIGACFAIVGGTQSAPQTAVRTFNARQGSMHCGA